MVLDEDSSTGVLQLRLRPLAFGYNGHDTLSDFASDFLNRPLIRFVLEPLKQG